ncbi:MAG: DUF6152 family protein [Acidobacteriota bacterium]
MRLPILRAGWIGAALLSASALWAHHSVTAVFDTSKQIVLAGELVDVEWVNPHIFLHMKSKDAAGAAQDWKVEGGPPAWYRRVGAAKASFAKHVGERVTVNGNPAKDGSAYGYLLKITFANGDFLESTSSAEAAKAK